MVDGKRPVRRVWSWVAQLRFSPSGGTARGSGVSHGERSMWWLIPSSGRGRPVAEMQEMQNKANCPGECQVSGWKCQAGVLRFGALEKRLTASLRAGPVAQNKANFREGEGVLIADERKSYDILPSERAARNKANLYQKFEVSSWKCQGANPDFQLHTSNLTLSAKQSQFAGADGRALPGSGSEQGPFRPWRRVVWTWALWARGRPCRGRR